MTGNIRLAANTAVTTKPPRIGALLLLRLRNFAHLPHCPCAPTRHLRHTNPKIYVSVVSHTPVRFTKLHPPLGLSQFLCGGTK